MLKGDSECLPVCMSVGLSPSLGAERLNGLYSYSGFRDFVFKVTYSRSILYQEARDVIHFHRFLLLIIYSSSVYGLWYLNSQLPRLSPAAILKFSPDYTHIKQCVSSALCGNKTVLVVWRKVYKNTCFKRMLLITVGKSSLWETKSQGMSPMSGPCSVQNRPKVINRRGLIIFSDP
jgi:hypothetical protein